MKKIISILLFSLSSLLLVAQTNIEKVKQLVDEGKYKIALEEAYNLLEVDSLSAALWNEIGELEVLNKQYNKAINSFNKVLKLDSTSTKVYLSLANSYYNAGRRSGAIETYKSILSKEPNNLAAISNLAKIYFSGRKDLAYKEYEKLANLDPTNASYVLMMVNCLVPNKEARKIFNLLKKAYLIDSTNASVASYLSKMYSYYDKYDSAMMVINSAIKLYPHEGRLYFRRGNVQAAKNYHFRSSDDFKKAIEFNFKKDIVIKNLGKSLFVIKKYEESRECFNKLFASQDTVDYQACMYMGNIYNELEKPDSALLYLNKAIKILTPENLVMASINSSKAKAYKIKKDYKKQIEHIKISNEYRARRGFLMNLYLLEIANIYDENLNNKKAALKYYTLYYNNIKDKGYVRETQKEKLRARINRIKEDLHFENH